MKWNEIINKKMIGDFSFEFAGEKGNVFISPHGVTQVHWGDDANNDLPKNFGMYDSIALMCQQFKMNDRSFGECVNEIDFIRVEYD